MDENLTRFNSLFAGDGPNRLFVYFQNTDPTEEVNCVRFAAECFADVARIVSRLPLCPFTMSEKYQ